MASFVGVSISDQYLGIATALFVLSQVSERLANFLKLYLPERWKLNVPLDDPLEEKEREGRVLLISISCGMFISATTLYWVSRHPELVSKLDWLASITAKRGLFLTFITGLFISFGSKFWHDALDVLYSIKRSREALVDPTTYTFDRTDDLEMQLRTTATDVAKKAIEQKGASLRAIDGVQAVGVGLLRFGSESRAAVEVHIRDDSARAAIPPTLPVEVNGRIQTIPVLCIVTGTATTMSGRLGGWIKNSAAGERTGTLGCVVFDRVSRQPFAVSCYHVMRGDHDWAMFQPIDQERIEAVGNGFLGTLCAGRRTDHTDTALAKLPPTINVDELLPHGKHIRGWRKLDTDDAAFETTVWFKGANHDDLVAARIYALDRAVSINYPDGERWMEGLIAITDRSSGQRACPSLPGDSGSIAFDKDGKAVGMIVAGDEAFCYLISMHNVLNAFDLDM